MRQRKRQTACKPGSVRTRECGTTIPLGRTSQCASRDQPGQRSGNAPAPCGATIPIRSCSRWGLPCRSCCQARGALLPPRFARARGLSRDACAGGVFSVALSLGSPPPGVTRHRIPVEPGLSSTAHAAAAVQPSDHTDMYDPTPCVKHTTNFPLPLERGRVGRGSATFVRVLAAAPASQPPAQTGAQPGARSHHPTPAP
jgi:hypothetical protein